MPNFRNKNLVLERFYVYLLVLTQMSAVILLSMNLLSLLSTVSAEDKPFVYGQLIHISQLREDQYFIIVQLLLRNQPIALQEKTFFY